MPEPQSQLNTQVDSPVESALLWIDAASDLLTIVASAIAVWLFITKRDRIKAVFDILLSYGQQLTLSDLKSKMERLNDLDANDPKQRDQVENILHEIDGQINGNPMLKAHMTDFQQSVKATLGNKKQLTEPRKRSLVSELRERVRHLDINNHNRE
jgi:hypothetical protein